MKTPPPFTPLNALDAATLNPPRRRRTYHHHRPPFQMVTTTPLPLITIPSPPITMQSPPITIPSPPITMQSPSITMQSPSNTTFTATKPLPPFTPLDIFAAITTTPPPSINIQHRTQTPDLNSPCPVSTDSWVPVGRRFDRTYLATTDFLKRFGSPASSSNTIPPPTGFTSYQYPPKTTQFTTTQTNSPCVIVLNTQGEPVHNRPSALRSINKPLYPPSASTALPVSHRQLHPPTPPNQYTRRLTTMTDQQVKPPKKKENFPFCWARRRSTNRNIRT